MTITVSTTDKRDGKALALFAQHEMWQRGKTKDGVPFFAVPSASVPGLFHMTTCKDCSCKDRQSRGVACFHMRAVRLWLAAFQTGAVSLKREASATPDAADDLAVLTPEGAAYLASLTAAPDVSHSNTSWTPCTRGCGALVEPMDAGICQDCRAKSRTAYSALFGDDEDDPYCGACRRHHLRGRHYVTVAV